MPNYLFSVILLGLLSIPVMGGNATLTMIPEDELSSALVTVPECSPPPCDTACELSCSRGHDNCRQDCGPRVHVTMSKPEIVHVKAPPVSKPTSCERDETPQVPLPFKFKAKNQGPYPGMVPVQTQTFQTTAFASFPVMVQQTNYAAMGQREFALGQGRETLRESDLDRIRREVASAVRNELANRSSGGAGSERPAGLSESAVGTDSGDIKALRKDLQELTKRVAALESAIEKACEEVKNARP